MERVGEHPVPAGPLAVRWLALRAARAPGGRRGDRTGRAPERRHGDLALARRERRPALLPLARRPRQRDRLGRAAGRVRAAGRARRGGRGRDASCARRSRRAATGSRSTSSRSSASGSPRSARRRSSWTSRWRRGSPSAGWRSSSTAATTTRPRPRWPRRRSRSSTRTRSRPRTSSRARCPSRTGRDACSTRTPRASPRSAARSRRATGRSAPWAPGGGRNPAFAHPLLLPSLLAGLEPGEHEGLPAYAPDGRAVDLRRPDQTSTATRSSTRLKTNAPSASATHRRDGEVDRVDRRGRLAEEERVAHGLDRRRQRVAVVDEVDEARVVLDARDALERVEHRRQEEPGQQQRGDEVLDVAVERVERGDGEREPRDEADDERGERNREPDGVARRRARRRG